MFIIRKQWFSNKIYLVLFILRVVALQLPIYAGIIRKSMVPYYMSTNSQLMGHTYWVVTWKEGESVKMTVK